MDRVASEAKEAMMKPAWVIVCCVAFALCVSAQGRGGVEDAFPLSKGTYWVYSGVVRFSRGGAEDADAEVKVTWKTEVVETISRDGLVAAVVRGFPGDLDWSEGNPARRDSLMVASQDGRLRLIGADDAAPALERVRDQHDPLQGLLQDENLLLALPLRQGKKFCDEEGMAREDGMYCWVVMAEEPAALDNVKGVPPGKRTVFTVRYATNPDDTEFDFVPGIGITSYGYHHHGTTADTELELVEFHAGAKE